MRRRLLDLAIAGPALVAATPLLIGLGVAVRIDSGGPALYRQQRVGRHGVPFTLLKLRTMRDAPGGTLTVGDDPRITRLGAVLRRHRLDELPQLVNVLRGEMAIVGPRPETPDHVALYTPEQREVLQARPGLTDPATLAWRHEADVLATADDPEALYRSEILPDKLARSREYLRRASVASDLAVIARTVAAVVRPGAPGRRG